MITLPKAETKLQPFLELAQQLSFTDLLKLIQLLLQLVQKHSFSPINGTPSSISSLNEIKPLPGWGEGQDLWADEAEFTAFEQYLEESRGHC